MTSCPKSAPVGSTPPSGRGLNAAERPPVRVTAATPGAPAEGSGEGTRGPLKRAGGVGHPAAPSVLRPAPDHSGAEGGLREPSPQAPARAPVAVPERGGQGNPSPQGREGTAGPGAPVPGPAQTSPLAVKGAAGGAREEEASVRTLRAGLPPATEPAGGAVDRRDAPSAGTTTPPGKEGRDAWRKALSAQARDRRIARGKWPARRAGSAYGPGMTRRQPPGSGGAA
jgi:hypothetical protein